MTMSGMKPKRSRGDGAMANDDEYWAAREERARAAAAQHRDDPEFHDRCLALLHRFATENTGWKAWFVRWYYSDEPLRNDAANLVKIAGFGMPMPLGTRLVGDDN